MANLGEPDTNCDDFFIVCSDDLTDFDDQYVKIGRVVSGMEHIKAFQVHGRPGGEVSRAISISKCGELEEKAQPTL